MENNKKRREAEKEKNTNSAKLILIVVALSAFIVVSAIALANWGEKNEPASESGNIIVADTILNDEGLTISNHSSEKGFPVSFSSNGIKNIKAVKNNIFVLTNEMISCVSRNGAHVFSHVLNYAEPVLKASGDYGIVYDRLSGKYTVFNNRKILFSKSTENDSRILTATISSNGSYAISSRNSDSASLLSYYNKNGELVYAWACSREHIVSIDISDNKKDILCAALNAKDGEIITKVYLLNVSKKETQWETEIQSAAAIDCFFTSSQKAIVVCTDKRIALTLKSSKEPIIVPYSSTALNYSSDDAGHSAVVTSKFGSFNSYDVTFYNSNNAVIGTYSTNKKIIDVRCVGRKAYVLTQDSILSVSASGKATTKIDLEDVELGIDVFAGNVYHFSLGYLFKN